MKTLILDGSIAHDPLAERVWDQLQQALDARGWAAERIVLRDQKIGNCAGDFFCWVKTPGVCNVNDDNRAVAAKVVASDLVIYLSPVTFGGFSSAFKRAQDHLIQNISPFFTSIDGEVHHQKRYGKYPRLLVIGWLAQPDPQAAAVFQHLAWRNSINMYASAAACGVLHGEQNNNEFSSALEHWLEQAAEKQAKIAHQALPQPAAGAANLPAPRRAVLLVGSPRTRESTSAALGGYLFEQLAERGLGTEVIQLYTSLNSAERMQALFKSIDQADLLVLAFPLYIDSLPAPVIAGLEKIAAHRAERGGLAQPGMFAAIANSGFPEAQHNETALAICAEFARQTGLTWMGSLALGGGEGLVHGTPLTKMDGRAQPLIQGLRMAAEALAQGLPIPQPARNVFARPVIPAFLYRLFGGLGWKQTAKGYGAQKNLRDQPYKQED
jgi:multimeric flavodoxin WrbA